MVRFLIMISFFANEKVTKPNMPEEINKLRKQKKKFFRQFEMWKRSQAADIIPSNLRRSELTYSYFLLLYYI